MTRFAWLHLLNDTEKKKKRQLRLNGASSCRNSVINSSIGVSRERHRSESKQQALRWGDLYSTASLVRATGGFRVKCAATSSLESPVPLKNECVHASGSWCTSVSALTRSAAVLARLSTSQTPILGELFWFYTVGGGFSRPPTSTTHTHSFRRHLLSSVLRARSRPARHSPQPWANQSPTPAPRWLTQNQAPRFREGAAFLFVLLHNLTSCIRGQRCFISWMLYEVRAFIS